MAESVPNAVLVLLRALLNEESWVEAIQLRNMFRKRLVAGDAEVANIYIEDHFGNSVKRAIFEVIDRPLVCVAFRNCNRYEHKVLVAYVEGNDGMLQRVDVNSQCYHVRGMFLGSRYNEVSLIERSLGKLGIEIRPEARAGRPP